MKAIVSEACVGCGLCPQICPEVFEMNADNRAVVIVTTIPSPLQANCREAASICPVDAIVLEE